VDNSRQFIDGRHRLRLSLLYTHQPAGGRAVKISIFVTKNLKDLATVGPTAKSQTRTGRQTKILGAFKEDSEEFSFVGFELDPLPPPKKYYALINPRAAAARRRLRGGRKPGHVTATSSAGATTTANQAAASDDEQTPAITSQPITHQ